MAIIIPSKNIYGSPQNPKVRDNVIERIEIGAVEVVPDNDYETPVYNEKNAVISSNLILQSNVDEKLQLNSFTASGGGSNKSGHVVGAYVLYDAKKNYDFIVYIRKTSNNHYISKLLLGKDKDGNPNIKYSVYGKLVQGDASTNVSLTWDAGGKASGTVDKNNITYTQTYVSTEQLLDFPQEIEATGDSTTFLENAVAKVELTDTGTAKDTTQFTEETIDGVEYYKLSFSLMSSIRTTQLSCEEYISLGQPTSITLSGRYVVYEPTEVEITVYGNTIGIDLKDKTVYIPKTDKTSKKVFSVEGNELMQDYSTIIEKKYSQFVKADIYDLDGDGYYNASATFTVDGDIVKVEDNSFNQVNVRISGRTATLTAKTSISGGKVRFVGTIWYKSGQTSFQERFEKTLNAYQNGKETATIRCSISDYYDGDQKVIAIDNSTAKMSFVEGDQVIPMVYGANGKDFPMSLNKDGSPKVFSVLGTKKYYNGAVWQELYLQEA
jgi:hypothetical protein